MTTFFLADTHFGHANIIKYESRPFSSADEMDKVLIENWNSCVGAEDTVFFLGDFALARADRILELMQQLAGQKYIVLGNHDRRRSVRFWERVGFDRVFKTPVRYGRKAILSHERLADVQITGRVNIYGHSHGVLQPFSTFRYCVSVENIGYRPVTWEWLRAQRGGLSHDNNY